MTLREFISLLGHNFDRAVDSISDFFSDSWNQILDAPLWLLVVIGFCIVSGLRLYVYVVDKKWEAEQKRIDKQAEEFWNGALGNDNEEEI